MFGLIGLMGWVTALSSNRVPIGPFSLVLVFPAIVILAAGRVVPPAPKGVDLRSVPGSAPLRALVEQAAREAGIRRLPKMMIDGEFGVALYPARHSVAGLRRRTLLIGFPLMLSTSPDQLQCLVAHQLLQLRNGRVADLELVYRQVMVQRRLFAGFGLRKAGDRGLFRAALSHFHRLAFAPFYASYLPRLLARAAGLSRQQLLEADLRAGQLTTPATLGQGLALLAVGERFMEQEFWPSFHRSLLKDPNPSPPFSTMERACSQLAARAAEKGWLEEELAERSQPGAFFPCLAQRLSALDLDQTSLPRPSSPTAARQLLDASVAGVARKLDERWGKAAERDLLSVQQTRNKAATELERLDAREKETPRSAADTWARAQAVDMTDDRETALALYESLLDDGQFDKKAAFGAGRLLTASGDDAGVAYLRQAAFQDDDPWLAQDAARVALHHLVQTGRESEAMEFGSRLADLQGELAPAHIERADIRREDQLVPHGLDLATLERIRSTLRDIPGLSRAYLVRRQLRHFADKPAFFLGVMTGNWVHVSWRRLHEVAASARHNPELPRPCLVVGMHPERHAWLLRKLNRVDNSRIL